VSLKTEEPPIIVFTKYKLDEDLPQPGELSALVAGFENHRTRRNIK